MKKKKLLVSIATAIVCICLLVIVLFTFTGCNKQIVDWNYTFTHAYVKIGNEWVDLEISKWNDYDGEQLQLKLKDGTVMVVSSVNCILYDGKLPKGA